MPRQLFTAADIRRLVHEQKAGVLVLGAHDLITPEAADVARQLGLRVVRQEREAAATPASPAGQVRLPPLKAARLRDTQLEPFGSGAVGITVALRDVVAVADGSPVAAGFMALDATQPGGGTFAWTLTYDEVDVVLAGELIITRGAEQVRGQAGDVLFIPKGSSITFGTPSYARFVYVAYPANWSSG